MVNSALATTPPAGPPTPEEESDLSYLLQGTGLDAPLALGPPDDPNYVEASKPDKDEVLSLVEDLQSQHGLRIQQSKQYSWFLDGDAPGYFKEDEELIENGIMEVMPLLSEREAHNFRCGYISMHDPYPKLLNRDSTDKEEACAVEDLVSFDFQSEERQYARTWGSDLRWAEPEIFQRFGMMVGLDVLNPEDLYCGLDMQFVDPLTVFPIFGGSNGVYEVYRVYQATNEQIIGTFGGRRGTDEYERIKKAVEKSASKKRRGNKSIPERLQLRTVTECWNDDYFAVYLDEKEELFCRKTNYRRTPFTIRIGCFGGPAGVAIGVSENRSDSYAEEMGGVNVDDASTDLARQLQPYGYRYMWAHHIAEAVAGRRLSYFKWSADPAKVLEYDPSTKHLMAKEVDLVPGQTFKIPLPNKLTLVTPVIDPNVMAGLAADLQSNVGTGALTMIRQGAVPPQTSGSALSKMVTLGGAGEAILVRGLQDFKRDRAEWRLHLREMFGDAIGKPLGTLRVPAYGGVTRTPLHEVTPAMIQRAGCQVDIELHHWQPDVALAQWISTLRAPSPLTGKPLISDTTARRKLKATPDVEREENRIEDEALSGIPPIQMQRQMARINKDIERALDMGDDESAESLMIAHTELEHLYMMAIATGQASPVGIRETQGRGVAGVEAGMPTPGAPAGGSGGPAPGLPGNSMTDMGGDTGHNGGRPQGSVQRMTPVTGGGTV